MKFCSKIGINDTYHRLKIDAEDEKYTAFLIPYGTYITRVIQLRDCNAPASFYNAMNNTFEGKLGVFGFLHIYDIFIFSNTYKEHLEHTRIVLNRLRKFKFYTNQSKSQLLPIELQVLGHIITTRGIASILQPVTHIVQCPIP